MRTPTILAALAVVALAAAAPQSAPAAVDAPDLWVSWLSVGPGPFKPGDSFIVKMKVENKGHAPAPGSAARGYVIHLSLGAAHAGFPAAPHAEPAPYRFVEGMRLKGGAITTTVTLRPGEAKEYQAKVLLPKDIQPGKYWLAFTVDPFNRVAEPQPHPDGEHNNVTNSEIQVVPR
ncbi:MAG: hypothetical protein ACOY3Y_14445 [Acidobacteriota bacterium]